MEKSAAVTLNPSAALVQGKSAQVSVSALTSLTNLPLAVSSLVNLGASVSVKLRGGTREGLRSAVTHLNQRTEIVSAAITLRGDRPPL